MWDAHVVEAVVVVYVLVVEPWTVTRLPWGGADHAKLRGAATICVISDWATGLGTSD